MARLELLASGPGTGKTTRCIELFRNEILKSPGGIDSRSFFILPNREHAERIQNLVLKKDLAGVFNAHILTIGEWAARLLGAASGVHPTDALRRAVLRGILESCHAGSSVPGFPYFEKVGECSGFLDLLVDSIKEFKTSLLPIGDFEKLSQPLLKDPAFRMKFRDFSVLLKRYESHLKSLGLREPEDDIAALIRTKRPRMELVIFDGFYRFTRAQEQLIKTVSRWSGHTVVTLTIPQNDRFRQALFGYPLRTRVFLSRAGFIERTGPFPKNRRAQDAAVLHLSENVFSKNPKKFRGPQRSVVMMEAPTLRAEVQRIAACIKELYRRSDAAFSDICIILRRVAGYEKIIEPVFSDYGIPVHIHERKKLIENGLGMTLARFLGLPLEGWKREDLFYVLKSSYVSKASVRQEVLRLESKAVSENTLEGRQVWQQLVARTDIGQKARGLLKRLLETEQAMLDSADFAGFRQRLFDWVGTLDIGGSADAVSAEEQQDSQAFQSFVSLIENARQYYQNDRTRVFSATQFLRQLRDSVRAALFSVRPAGKNRVQVYDVVMALPKEYKVVFLPGLLEKVFPEQVREDALFKDDERRLLNKKGTVLEERLWRIGGERYFFYMALTRATQRIYLSYPLVDAQDKPTLPSFFLEEVKKCFDGLLPLRPEPAHVPAPSGWQSEHEVAQGLAYEFFRRQTAVAPVLNSGMLETLNEWMTKDYFREVLEGGLSAGTAVLKDPKVRAVFQTQDEVFSATRLETFVTCAFKYFCQRVLGLAEPSDNRQALEMGNILHGVLEEFYRTVPEKDRTAPGFWSDPEKAKATLIRLLDSQLEQKPFLYEPLYRRNMHRASMAETLKLFAEREEVLLARRGLVPAYFELEFGASGGNGALGYLKIPGDGADIRIRGKIDRIDLTPDRKKALLVDYKRSRRPVPVSEKLSQGTELQLPVYILALRRLLDLDVMGAELRYLRGAGIDGIYLESARQTLGIRAGKNLYRDSEMEKIVSDAQALIRASVRRLREADISVRSKSCEHCPFDSVCRFEKWRLVYSADRP